MLLSPYQWDEIWSSRRPFTLSNPYVKKGYQGILVVQKKMGHLSDHAAIMEFYNRQINTTGKQKVPGGNFAKQTHFIKIRSLLFLDRNYTAIQSLLANERYRNAALLFTISLSLLLFTNFH